MPARRLKTTSKKVRSDESEHCALCCCSMQHMFCFKLGNDLAGFGLAWCQSIPDAHSQDLKYISEIHSIVQGCPEVHPVEHSEGTPVAPSSDGYTVPA